MRILLIKAMADSHPYGLAPLKRFNPGYSTLR